MRSDVECDDYAKYAWYGLGAYVLVVDVLLILNGKKTMTEIWYEALHDPVKKWGVILAWGFTTKHLFYKDFLPMLDPFCVIGASVEVIKKLTNRRINDD